MKVKLLALTVALFCFAASARADQMGTLTSGSFTAQFDGDSFNYSGSFDGRLESDVDVNFEGSGTEDNTPFPFAFSPFEPGARISFSGAAFGSDFGGSITVDGETYAFNRGLDDPNSGGIEFVGGEANAPTDGRETVTLRAPFTVTGFANIAAIDEEFILTGKGTAELTLRLRDSDGFYVFENITYVAAVPEPATMILLGTGIAGLAVRFRRRK